MKFFNAEYSNIFFNTFNYSKINSFEEEYLEFSEVFSIEIKENFKNEQLKISRDNLEFIKEIKDDNKINYKINKPLDYVTDQREFIKDNKDSSSETEKEILSNIYVELNLFT